MFAQRELDRGKKAGLGRSAGSIAIQRGPGWKGGASWRDEGARSTRAWGEAETTPCSQNNPAYKLDCRWKLNASWQGETGEQRRDAANSGVHTDPTLPFHTAVETRSPVCRVKGERACMHAHERRPSERATRDFVDEIASRGWKRDGELRSSAARLARTGTKLCACYRARFAIELIRPLRFRSSPVPAAVLQRGWRRPLRLRVANFLCPDAAVPSSMCRQTCFMCLCRSVTEFDCDEGPCSLPEFRRARWRMAAECNRKWEGRWTNDTLCFESN